MSQGALHPVFIKISNSGKEVRNKVRELRSGESLRKRSPEICPQCLGQALGEWGNRRIPRWIWESKSRDPQVLASGWSSGQPARSQEVAAGCVQGRELETASWFL